MPWKHNGRIIKEGRGWVSDDGVKHPGVWTRWTDSEKNNFGLVWEDPPVAEEPFDNRFYSGRDSDGTLIEKNLADVNEVDGNGDAITDPDTGQQMVTKGLKTEWIEITKEKANILLAETDWMIIRKAEKETAIPDAVQTYRNNVRTACDTREKEIDACSDTAALVTLYSSKEDGTPNMTQYPEDPNS